MSRTGPALRVSHIMAFADRDDGAVFSGAENHLFTLMAAQVQAGLDVELIMLIARHGPRLHLKIENLRKEGIAVLPLVHEQILTKIVGRATRAFMLPRLVLALAQRRDRIIHTHLPHASQLGRLAAWMTGNTKIVDTVHNDEPWFARPSWRLRLRLLDKMTARTIAISEHIRTHLVRVVGLDPARIAVVHYGIRPPSGPQPTREELRNRLGIPQDAFTVGFIGRLTAQKDVPTLLRALAALPDAHAMLVGTGEEKEELKRLAAALGLRHVRFLGYKPDAASLMPAFDVLALPSRWEGLGLVLLEAMVRHIPIVASRAGAIPEILDHGRCGVLADAGDVSGFASALERLARDRALRTEIAARAWEHVQANFSIDAMVSRTTDVYRDVTEHAEGRH